MEVKRFGLVIGDFFIAQDKDITIGMIVFSSVQKPDILVLEADQNLFPS